MPPAEWKIYGKNPTDKDWILINDPGIVLDFCPKGDDQKYLAQCNKKSSYQSKFDYPTGPFRYIRYFVLQSRDNNLEAVAYGFMRIDKIDFYGSIWIYTIKSVVFTSHTIPNFFIFIWIFSS